MLDANNPRSSERDCQHGTIDVDVKFDVMNLS